MNKKALSFLVCPKCGGELTYIKKDKVLYCVNDDLFYPVKDGIPVLVVEEAIPANKKDSAKNISNNKNTDANKSKEL